MQICIDFNRRILRKITNLTKLLTSFSLSNFYGSLHLSSYRVFFGFECLLYDKNYTFKSKAIFSHARIVRLSLAGHGNPIKTSKLSPRLTRTRTKARIDKPNSSESNSAESVFEIK